MASSVYQSQHGKQQYRSQRISSIGSGGKRHLSINREKAKIISENGLWRSWRMASKKINEQ